MRTAAAATSTAKADSSTGPASPTLPTGNGLSLVPVSSKPNHHSTFSVLDLKPSMEIIPAPPLTAAGGPLHHASQLLNGGSLHAALAGANGSVGGNSSGSCGGSGPGGGPLNGGAIVSAVSSSPIPPASSGPSVGDSPPNPLELFRRLHELSLSQKLMLFGAAAGAQGPSLSPHPGHPAAHRAPLMDSPISSGKPAGRYRCEFCDYHAVTPSHLRRHQRTHTGERPYECNICSRRFTQKPSLKSHLSTQHGIS